MTAKELAAEVGVSERTIYRDVEKLSLAGIPIYANQGKNAGIALLPNYVLDKTVLSDDEKKKILDLVYFNICGYCFALYGNFSFNKTFNRKC